MLGGLDRVFAAPALTVFALGILYFCLLITRDYRLRKRLYDETIGLETSALYVRFQEAMWVLGLYCDKPFRPVIPFRHAERALVLASVLREHIHHRAGAPPPSSYLSSRRQLISAAKHYVRSQRGQ